MFSVFLALWGVPLRSSFHVARAIAMIFWSLLDAST